MTRSGDFANPVRKRRLPRLDGIEGAGLAVLSGWGPWVAICDECGVATRGGHSRKVAKDRLHQHRLAVHA